MWLVNFPNIRIQKYPQGYAVEIEKKKWWGKKYWIHIEAYNGLPDESLYFSSFGSALNSAVIHFKKDLIAGSG